jgi:hypothetical protein
MGKMLSCLVLALSLNPLASAQKEAEEPVATVSLLVIKDDNGKPVRNAAVMMHPVGNNGKQGRGGVELKTDGDGKTSFEEVPYGKLRVQVLASGFQTFGEDYDIEQPKMSLTIKLKHPQSQYSLYGSQPEQKKGDNPPAANSNQNPSPQ